VDRDGEYFMGEGVEKKRSFPGNGRGDSVANGWCEEGGGKGTRKGVRKEVIKMKGRKEGRRKLVSNERRLYV